MKDAIQIAGVIDKQEARMLVDAGVDYIGFPLRLKDGREDLTEDEAAEIIHSLIPPVYGVVITYISDAAEIHKFCTDLNARVVQLHGSISTDQIIKLKKLSPELFIIKSLVVRENNMSELETLINDLSPHVDSFITDTFDPLTGRTGATGKVHDWNVSREIVDLSTKPVILAGGLTADNVAEAISVVKPAGVDSHTGVEKSNGRKDPVLVNQFVTNAKSAFLEI